LLSIKRRKPKSPLRSGLPDFSWHSIPKRVKDVPHCHYVNYQMPLKCTNLPLS
jgi:hypothetical protein